MRYLLAAILAVASQAGERAVAESPPALEEQLYDIPAQPLDAALARYSQISRVDIIYDSVLPRGRNSVAIAGRFTAQRALAKILEGTGFGWRFARSNAALIFSPERAAAVARGLGGAEPTLNLDVLHVRASPLIGAPSHAAFNAYGQKVMAELDRLLRPDAERDRRNFRAVVRLWISPEGVVTHADFLNGTGDRRIDERVLERLAALRFEAPPKDLPQPMRFQIEMR